MVDGGVLYSEYVPNAQRTESSVVLDADQPSLNWTTIGTLRYRMLTLWKDESEFVEIAKLNENCSKYRIAPRSSSG